jgi:hypothetical protein
MKEGQAGEDGGGNRLLERNRLLGHAEKLKVTTENWK